VGFFVVVVVGFFVVVVISVVVFTVAVVVVLVLLQYLPVQFDVHEQTHPVLK
jgi:hypothetical protein